VSEWTKLGEGAGTAVRGWGGGVKGWHLGVCGRAWRGAGHFFSSPESPLARGYGTECLVPRTCCGPCDGTFRVSVAGTVWVWMRRE
jgi:hypothetical protein